MAVNNLMRVITRQSTWKFGLALWPMTRQDDNGPRRQIFRTFIHFLEHRFNNNDKKNTDFHNIPAYISRKRL